VSVVCVSLCTCVCVRVCSHTSTLHKARTHLGHTTERIRQSKCDVELTVRIGDHSELELVRAHIESLRSRTAKMRPAPADASQTDIGGEPSGVPLFLAELATGWQELGSWVTGTIDEGDTTGFERSEEFLRPRTLQQCTAKLVHIQGKTPKSKAIEQHL
jgi:hypothetical protein